MPTKIIHEFTIERSNWYRGKGTEESFLRRKEDGQQCCVGFLAKSLGLSDEDITEQPTLGLALFLPKGKRTKKLRKIEKELRNKALSSVYIINDATTVSDTEREEYLTTEFLEANIAVTFVD